MWLKCKRLLLISHHRQVVGNSQLPWVSRRMEATALALGGDVLSKHEVLYTKDEAGLCLSLSSGST